MTGAAYLKDRWRLWLFLGTEAAVLWAVFVLYRLPAEAAVYAAALCLPAGLWLVWGDYRRFCRLRRQLAAMLEQAQQDGTAPALPPPPSKEPLEQDLWTLLDALCRRQAQDASHRQRTLRQLADRYVLWVHQIKTPLSALSLLVQEQGGEGRSGEIRVELLKIEQYVELLLTDLRLGFDSTDHLLRTYDLDGLIRSALRKYAGLFILKKISLRFTPTDLQVLTDEKWLSVVIEQLLSNALKYTPAGGEIRIWGEGETLLIADNGIGIRPEDQKRVFEAGFTGCNGRLEKRSTGIGLYLCRQIADRLGHGLRLTSRPGAGTCAALDLTRQEVTAE